MAAAAAATDATPVAGRVEVDLSKSRFDLTTYGGRVRHFFNITDPSNILASEAELTAAKTLLAQYKAHNEPAGTTTDELWQAKKIYDSAFHPQTGELMWWPGRMSFCVPGNMCISGCMLTFYQTVPAVVFWQVANQSFNACVNYVNRNASTTVGNKELAMSFGVGVGSATAVALGLNRLVQLRPLLATGLVGRLVPFVAVASANAVNIPFMRWAEFEHGIELTDNQGEVITDSAGHAVLSVNAAKQAVASTLVCRVALCIPGMTFPPILTNYIHKKSTIFKRFPKLELAFQIGLCGLCVALAMPVSMAMFPQQSFLKVEDCEPAVAKTLRDRGMAPTDLAYFNKGL